VYVDAKYKIKYTVWQFFFLDTSQASADVSLTRRSLISAVVDDEGMCVCVQEREWCVCARTVWV